MYKIIIKKHGVYPSLRFFNYKRNRDIMENGLAELKVSEMKLIWKIFMVGLFFVVLGAIPRY